VFFTSVKFDRNSTVNFAVDKVVELDEVFSVNNRREEDFRRRSLVFAGLNTFRTDNGCDDRGVNHFAAAAGISTTIAHFLSPYSLESFSDITY